MNNRSLQGFTLSELLVSLAVLGLIAAFAIPKVLTAVGTSSARAIGGELIATVSQAYEALRSDRNGSLSRSTKGADLVGKMNYKTSVTATGVVTVTFPNGGTIQYKPTDDFSDGTKGVIGFNIDPDGGTTSTSQYGPASVYIANDGRFWLAYSDYGPNFAQVAATDLTPATSGTPSEFNDTYEVSEDTNNVAKTPVVPSSASGSDNTWAS
jgi:prepilin-type N-terminal cleavage/methylation domain-containing protein